MYLSRERKHKKNITNGQNLQVASFNGNLWNQCKDDCFLEEDKERTFEYFFIF